MQATCHPEREHYSRGLCNPCWQRQRYQTDPVFRAKQLARSRAGRRAYYLAHQEQLKQKARSYYAGHRPRQVALAVARNNKKRGAKAAANESMNFIDAARRASTVLVANNGKVETINFAKPSEKNWWKTSK